MRVNVQLIDAETGNHLWAERFDKPVADLFDMQDEIVARLANSLNTQLITAEARRAERAPSPDSMDHYFQGMAWFNKGFAPDNLYASQKLFREGAVTRCRQRGGACRHCMGELRLRPHPHFGRSPRSLGGRSEHCNQGPCPRAGASAGHMCLGLAYVFNYRATQGIAQCERALALDRNLAVAHAYIGMAKWFVGRGEETQGHIDEAFRLSPRDTLAYFWSALAGIARIFTSASIKKPSQACVTQLKSMEILPCIIFTSPLRWRNSANWMRHGFRGARPVSRSTRPFTISALEAAGRRERQSDVFSKPANQFSKSHAQGRGAGGMKQV